jgi:hypothetical protein
MANYANWILAHSLGVSSPAWSVTHNPGGTTIQPATISSNIISFAIPTPTVVNSQRVGIVEVLIQFASGPQTKLQTVQVYHGATQLQSWTNQNIGGANQTLYSWTLSAETELAYGIGVSFEFETADLNDPTDSTITLIGAAATFQIPFV